MMKIQVGVFFGGQSVEHEVSIISGLQALAALPRDKYDAVPIYITKEGKFFTGDAFADIAAYRDTVKLLSGGHEVVLRGGGPVQRKAFLYRLQGDKVKGKPLHTLDVALPVVHGTHVEDGTLQGYFDTLGLPYVGCDVLSSAVCMDKWATKCLLQSEGLPVLPGKLVTNGALTADPLQIVSALEGTFGYPMMVKPVNLGSSVGITKVNARVEFLEALNTAFRFADRALIEPAVTPLREINCAVLGDREEAIPSACEEPIGSDAILSFADKYLAGSGKAGAKTGVPVTHAGAKTTGGMSSLKRRLPAEITPEQTETVQKLAVRAFQALGCSGVARIDFLYDTNEDRFLINELNTIPGSLSFYLWEATGLPFGGLLEKLIGLAFSRARAREALTFHFSSNILSGVVTGKLGKR